MLLKRFSFPRTLTLIFLLLLVCSRFPAEKAFSIAYAQDAPPSPAQVIEAVNALRIEAGLYPLSVHPVLMQVAQTEADGIANGLPGHWRPEGLTLGMWLISLGYPLAGDLTLDGYRSENWGTARQRGRDHPGLAGRRRAYQHHALPGAQRYRRGHRRC